MAIAFVCVILWSYRIRAERMERLPVLMWIHLCDG